MLTVIGSIVLQICQCPGYASLISGMMSMTKDAMVTLSRRCLVMDICGSLVSSISLKSLI